MAYFRGDDYIWSDGESLHLWSRDGADGWETRYEDENEQRLPGWENASGVAIREEIINQFVMMRLARLLVEETAKDIENIIDQAVQVENYGADFLRRNAQTLKAAFRALNLKKPAPP